MKEEMQSSNSTTESQVPASLILAKKVSPVRPDGHYDEESQTWSHRKYDVVASKKHNEQM